ncbi:MAG: hypothetical protein QNL62_18285 [Gammaproteobacteria bacterium]|nr:hypothetical protein [Gammaproteobacteria bacterium]
MARLQRIAPLGIPQHNLAKRISTISKVDCEKLASQVVAADTTQQVLELLQLATDRHAPFLC